MCDRAGLIGADGQMVQGLGCGCETLGCVDDQMLQV